MNQTTIINRRGEELKLKNNYKKNNTTQGTPYAAVPVKALLNRSNGLSPAAKDVYIYLLWRSAKNGYMWGTQKDIASELGIRKETVSRALTLLEKKGFIDSDLFKKENNKKYMIYMPLVGSFFTTSHTKKSPKQNNMINKARRKDHQGMTKSSSPLRNKEYDEVILINNSSKQDTTTGSDTKLMDNPENLSSESTGKMNPTNTNDPKYNMILDQYRKHVDSKYTLQTRDRKTLHEFDFVLDLARYIRFWPDFINPKHEKGKIDNYSIELDEFDVNHTAKIHVIIKHWNTFKDYAEMRIKKEKREMREKREREWSEQTRKDFDSFCDSITPETEQEILQRILPFSTNKVIEELAPAIYLDFRHEGNRISTIGMLHWVLRTYADDYYSDYEDNSTRYIDELMRGIGA